MCSSPPPMMQRRITLSGCTCTVGGNRFKCDDRVGFIQATEQIAKRLAASHADTALGQEHCCDLTRHSLFGVGSILTANKSQRTQT